MMINQNDVLDENFPAMNGSEFRRLRFFTSGILFGNVKFKMQFDFARGDAGVKDAYIELTKIPGVGHIRVGHFKQPFGFELLTSSNDITLMERSLTDAFTPERDLGAMVYNHQFNKRFSWYAGYFFPTRNVGLYLGNQYRLTFRVAGQPIYKPDGRWYTVMHLGVAYEHQFNDNRLLILNDRPEAHLTPKYVTLSVKETKTAEVMGSEFVFIFGPLSFQGEYMTTKVVPSPSMNTNFTSYYYNAGYAIISWFITGEHKNYSQKKTAFGRLAPKRNLGKGGWGAFEISLRYSSINLNDKDLRGGSMQDITAGLNWYLNPAVRVMFNYIYSDVGNQGFANIYQMRFQVAF
ncbi:MAG: hypothetical protein GXO86_03660 [Chlorobi bacterium]|nr:hypothetical protein [Chlorobiota bacterium]